MQKPRVTYPVDLYLAVHSGNDGDVDFYRRVAAEATDVLELGCGAGRIAHALAADGKRVVGVDSNPELVALADPSQGTFRVGDVRELRLEHTFDRVIAPYNLLYCLRSEAEVLEMFRAVWAHLRPEGYFVFDVWSADGFHAEADPEAEDAFERVKTVEARGTLWDVYERSDWDPSEQRIDAHYRHVPRDGGAVVEASIAQRYVLSAQVDRLLGRAGFERVAFLGAFDDEAYSEESALLIGVAQPKKTRP